MDVRPLIAPEKIFVALTSLCNLRCKHCNVFPYRSSPADFSLEEWRGFFDQVQAAKVFSLWFSGGEPFCRDDLFQILDDAHGRPLHLDGLNTNGTLISPDHARRLRGYRKLDLVQVGLDGADAESHDRLRGRGVFRRAVAGIEALVSAGLTVTLFTVVTRFNVGRLEATVRLARELGVRGVNLSLLLPQGNALHYGEEMALSDEQWRGAVGEAGGLARAYPGLVSGSMVDMDRMFRDFEERLAAVEGRSDVYLTGCKTGVTECTVMSDGRVLPCDRLQDVVAGNLREQSLLHIWRHSPVFAEFRSRFSVRLDDLDSCRGCRYQPLCTGGCPAIPHVLEGTLLGRDRYSCYRVFRGEDPPQDGS